MKVLPAVDIMGGRVVQLVGGRPGTEQVVLPDPVEVALYWERLGAPGLHVVDLDAAMERGDNRKIVRVIIDETTIPVQVGGGVRSTEAVERLLEWGAHAVIVGTKGILEPAWLESVTVLFPASIILALDVRRGLVQVRGWQESSGISVGEMFRIIRPLPLAAVLYTNVDIEGKAAGIDEVAVSHFVRDCPHPVIASGGIATIEDLRTLESMGVSAAVVGVALYTGKLNPTKIWGPWK